MAMAETRAEDRSGRQGLLRLMAWLSPAFPVGGFSYSAGMESAVVEGHVGDGDGVEAWLGVLLAHGGLRNDAILLAEAHRVQGEGQSLEEIISLATALASSAERHAETTRLGEAFVKAAAAWPHPVIDALVGPVPYGVAVGAVAAAHGVDRTDAIAAFLHAQISQHVSVAIRLGVIGQTRGVSILAASEAPILDAASSYARLDLDDLGSATIIADTLSMRHEVQYSRLFQS
ncbi:urease accessory protein UreF [Rhizobium sp. WL3]|uniref:urease accessory protein UreF n=1 Tax=Rhizobium sp. WL3 TaxID=2603277 RepID=UPI001650A831|nr:urease accessory protein UreF [Rhizobium sp. WL3]